MKVLIGFLAFPPSAVLGQGIDTLAKNERFSIQRNLRTREHDKGGGGPNPPPPPGPSPSPPPPAPPPPGPDTLLHFNKFDFSGVVDGNAFAVDFPEVVDESLYDDLLPLTGSSFPISDNERVVDMLRVSNAISPVTEDDYEVKGHSIRELVDLVGSPSHPTSDLASPFWDDLR